MRLDLATLASEARLDECSKKMIAALRDHNDVFETSLHNQTNAITGLHQDTRQVTIDEHEVTRSVIVKAVKEAGKGRKRHTGWKKPTNPEVAKLESEMQILRSLLFPSITARYSQVAQAHADTFEWVFNSPTSRNHAWSDFKEWLQNGNEIYWINGKAGSGKLLLLIVPH